MKELRKIAGDELAKNLITGIIKDGNDTFDKIAVAVKGGSNTPNLGRGGN